MFEINSYAAQSCCRMRISRAYPYGGVHSYTFFRRDIITPFARELIEAPAFFVLGFPEFNQKERNFP